MINVEEIKQKILVILEQRGPSLPIHLTKQIDLSPTFTSAILSELSNEKRVKLSSLKIGSSPLYFLPGQEQKIESFADNLEGMEKQAFLKIKQSKILKDENQEPAIRVALRRIRDFAIPLKFQDKLFWKYFSISNQEVQDKLNKKQTLTPKKEIVPKKEPLTAPLLKEELLLENKTNKKTKPIPDKFLNEIKDFLVRKDIEFLEEIKIEKKEVIAKIRINSDLGKIILLLVAKDKKRFTQADITLAYQQAIENKMPCLFLSYGEPSKKLQEWLENYKNMIKVMKI